LYGAFGDLVKDDARQAGWLLADGICDVKRDRLTLSILIGREVNFICTFSKLFYLFYDGGVIAADAILWGKFIILYLDAKARFWQVSDVAF
jgi:hypothetical protein